MELLDKTIVEILSGMGVKELFPVQRAIVPAVLSGRDVLVRSPTGSGKTLAYVLPILQRLASVPALPRAVCRSSVRALVVVPTRDIAVQVHDVICSICGSPLWAASAFDPLRVSLLIGGGGAAAVTSSSTSSYTSSSGPFRGKAVEGDDEDDDMTGYGRALAGLIGADVVVATAGRLHDVASKAGDKFSLENLLFLVIDEADRMLSGDQNMLDWIALVMAAAHNTTPGTCSFPPPSSPSSSSAAANIKFNLSKNADDVTTGGCCGGDLSKHESGANGADWMDVRLCRLPYPACDEYRGMLCPRVFPAHEFARVLRNGGSVPPPLLASSSPRLQKLLFSATLVESARKLVPLRMADPVRFDSVDGPIIETPLPTAEEEGGKGRSEQSVAEALAAREQEALDGTELDEKRFQLPATLSQYMVVCERLDLRVWIAATLTRVWGATPVPTLCFASSLESVRAAVGFLGAWEGGNATVAEYSSELTAEAREEALAAFKRGDVTVLVTTDILARGLDVPSVDVVLNIDAPHHVRTYVHRAGRTARAGKAGAVYTLVRPEEVPMFRTISSQVQESKKPAARLKFSKEEIMLATEQTRTLLPRKRDLIKKYSAKKKKRDHTPNAGYGSAGRATAAAGGGAGPKRPKLARWDDTAISQKKKRSFDAFKQKKLAKTKE